MTTQKNTIGYLSRQTAVKVTTIRYYESIGLMPDPARTESGQRVYDSVSVERLNFIRHARELGFSVEDIRELIALQTQPSHSCKTVDEIARRHQSGVARRISQLSALESELNRMIRACRGGKIATCKVLDCLSDHEQCKSDSHEKLDIVVSG